MRLPRMLPFSLSPKVFRARFVFLLFLDLAADFPGDAGADKAIDQVKGKKAGRA